MSRRTTSLRAAAWFVLATVLVVGVLIVEPASWLADDPVAATSVVRDTGTVEISTLETSFEADGTLSYRADTVATIIAPPAQESATTVGTGRSATTQVTVTPASMVITELVAEGRLVEQGDVLWRLGNEPTVVLLGETPAFRDLEEGVEGSDVLQLETALVALGFDPDGTVTIDEDFTALTEAMVERWQESVGAEVDGIVHHGSVVFADGPSLVGDTGLRVGDTALDGQSAFELSTQDVELEFVAEPSERETLVVGDVVDGRSDGERFSATVVSSTLDADGGATIVAVPDTPLDLPSDTAPAEVTWVLELAADVVTVPAAAILRTDDQRTWVEVRDPDGGERWVEVAVGRASGGRVEVTGELEVGDRVIAP